MSKARRKVFTKTPTNAKRKPWELPKIEGKPTNDDKKGKKWPCKGTVNPVLWDEV